MGFRLTVGESGLLATPEVVFAVAAMRYLVDPKDTLALVELFHFSSDTWGEGRWLTEWLNPEKRGEMLISEPFIQDLDEARSKIAQMSPSEVLDLALVTARVDEVSLKWGMEDQRLANLDSLRKIAATYEDTAATNGTAATIGGFLLFLNEVEKDKDLNLVAESTDENAVRVLTYHKAKGLEWPFVILNSLGKSSKRNKPPVFDRVTAVSTKGFNVQDPLNGRKLYYWPWPYGGQSSNVALDAFVENAPELVQRQQQLIDENQRLMYVGMTRARDYLVFTARDFSKVGWIDELTNAEGHQVLTLGVANENQDDLSPDNRDGKIIVKGKSFPCKARVLSIDESSEPDIEHDETEELIYVGQTVEGLPFVPARFSPSGQKIVVKHEDETRPSPSTEVANDASKIHRIGSRLPLSGNPDMAVLGEMVHAFLAADDQTKTRDVRLAMAQSIRDRFGISALSGESMLEASDRLEQFITQHYSELISQYFEYPIHLRKGLQKASGWIDLLLQTSQGWVIVDHKSFPGKEADWLSRGTSYLPQLQTYAEAVFKATGIPVIEAWIHMPVVGAMIHFTKEELDSNVSSSNT
ncbi:3'-5' exonuclease [Bacillus sp. T3]|uniref:3'-5' exonuclease n=1 Tax=Bacillus sp. T3 TaxID=467262 RepID=UPI00298275A7|nr:3'-5' exonuclease [Bacillus sp. T3]